MSRILQLLLTVVGLALIAAEPIDKRPQPETANTSAAPVRKTDGNNGALQPPPLSKAAAPGAAKGAQPLPNEREAIDAAYAAKGWAQYADRGPVTSICCDDASDADLRLFAALGGLERLSLCGARVTDAGLAALEKTRTLRHLWFGYAIPPFEGRRAVTPQITNEGLKSIGRMAGLESLGLCVPQITGAGMAHLDGLKHLQSLYLTRSGVGDDGMRSIAGHTTLRRLHLGREVTRRGLAELAHLTSLTELRTGRRLNDEDLLPIGQMTDLVTLQCSFVGVTDEGLRRMKNMTRLRSLDLSSAHEASDVGMAYVAQMTGLETLDLQATNITDMGLAKITALRQLRLLSLMETRVTAAGVAQLRGMKKLEHIGLDYTDISADDVAQLKDSGIPVSKTGGSYHSWMKR